MNIRIVSQTGTSLNLQVARACCPFMGKAIEMAFVVPWAQPPNLPQMAFRGPGQMIPFRVCPWCAERIEITDQRIVLPETSNIIDIRGDGNGQRG